MQSNDLASGGGLTARNAEADTLYWIWRRRAVRLRLFISGFASWVLHGSILLLVVWGGRSLVTKKNEPPKLGVVAAVGELMGAPGIGDDGITPGLDDGPFSPPPLENSDTPVTIRFVPDDLPSSVANSLAKPVDLELPGAESITSMITGSVGGIDGGLGRGNGGRGGGDGTGPIGMGSGWSSTEFMKVQASGTKFVYVLDRSGSMSHGDRLGAVKRELLASLGGLSPDAQFQIIFYNLRPDAVLQPKALKLHFATEHYKLLAAREIDKIVADGGTEHLPALKSALSLHPDVIFFLTDADDLRPHDVKEVTDLNKGRANIHTIEFAVGPEVDRENMLRNLAAANGGTYRYIDVTKLARANQTNDVTTPRVNR
jgi:hypothetical protein